MSLVHLQERLKIPATGILDITTLNAAIKFFKLTPIRAAHFFGQLAHETGDFKVFTENLNYSADGLRKTFGKYFAEHEFAQYARQPERIANRVYANRIGNGDESSGDGWRFRGRGAVQLTGRANYQEFSDLIKRPDIMKDPDLIAEDFSFVSAVFFFNKNKLWALCDHGLDDAVILAITRKINGGTLGLEDRKQKTLKYAQMLGISNKIPTLKPVQETSNPRSSEPKLSENFYLKDFIKSETAIRKNIDNTPTTEHLENLKIVCREILEPVYRHYRRPVRINSAYRGPQLNAAVGGSSKSQHCSGQAVDFEIDGLPNLDLARWISKNLDFDQLILEFYDPKEGGNSGWIHCSYTTKDRNRNQILTAINERGKTVYKPGFVV